MPNYQTLRLTTIAASLLLTISAFAAERKSLFDGKTFAGWEGDTQKTWRIEEGVIAGGSLETTVPQNEFLCTVREYENFDLRLKFKLVGTEGFVNGGVQFRTKRIPNHHEVSGFQADIGAGMDGNLYDESRRNKILAKPTDAIRTQALKPNEWNDYRIRCEGNRIRLWLNETLTVDYKEDDPKVESKGIIGLQIHGGCKAVIRFKELEIEELP